MEAGCSKSDGKQADRSVYRYKARKIVRKKFLGRLVRMRSPVQIWVAAPRCVDKRDAQQNTALSCGVSAFFKRKARKQGENVEKSKKEERVS